MTEVEKKAIGKTEIGLIVCGVIVAVLAISNILVYVSLQNQIETLETDNGNLQSQMTDLQIDKSSLQTQVNNLQTENSQLEDEIDSLISDYNSLSSEYNDYAARHLYTNEEYIQASFSLYYVYPKEQKFGVYDLEDELYGLEWIEPYQEGVFDCSEMSAYLEWHLENEGWHTIIILGEAPFGDGYHAWLLVETSADHYMPVESTTIEIVWWDDPYFDNYFIYDYEFETIQEALDYYETEFDWWV